MAVPVKEKAKVRVPWQYLNLQLSTVLCSMNFMLLFSKKDNIV